MKKVNKCQSIQRVSNFLAWHPAVFHLKKPQLGLGGKLTNMDDEVIKIVILNIINITIKCLYTLHNITIL
jgi:hypothetical protein